MGFNFFEYGNIHPCGIANHKVYFTLPSGMRIEYNTKLDVEIPEQTNLFISDTVLFLLYHDDKMYIGRKDTSISIYRISDGLLVGLNTWDAPKYAEVELCGFYNDGNSMHEIQLDLRDKRTVYICGNRMQGLLPKENTAVFDPDKSVFSASIHGNKRFYHIYDERGEVVEVNAWTVQKDLWSQNCPVFL